MMMSNLLHHYRNHLVYINRKSKKSKLNTKSMSIYQISRFLIGRLMCLFLNFFLLDTKIGDTQAGLKAFIKPKNFIQIKFIMIGINNNFYNIILFLVFSLCFILLKDIYSYLFFSYYSYYNLSFC